MLIAPARPAFRARVTSGGRLLQWLRFFCAGTKGESVEEFLAEDFLRSAVDVLVRIVEAGGAVIIFAGALAAFFKFIVTAIRSRRSDDFVPVRLSLGRFLALGLEFQLAGDILRTAILRPSARSDSSQRSLPSERCSTSSCAARFARSVKKLEARRASSGDVESKNEIGVSFSGNGLDAGAVLARCSGDDRVGGRSGRGPGRSERHMGVAHGPLLDARFLAGGRPSATLRSPLRRRGR